MAANKTTSIAKLLLKVNNFLSNPNTSKDGRRAMSLMIEDVLHESGNYRGFSILEDSDISPHSDASPVRFFYYISTKLENEYKELDV
jgi:hypothetical protein